MDKALILFVFSLMVLSCQNQNERISSDYNMEYEIFFADGFEKSEISIRINEGEWLKSVISSDPTDGLTKLNYRIMNNGQRTVLIEPQKGDEIIQSIDAIHFKLELRFNNNEYSYDLDKNKGKYLIISHFSDSLYFEQSKIVPEFD